MKPSGHANGLDCLRGLLSLIVVVAHAWQIFIRPLDNGTVSTASVLLGFAARAAVLCFFCLSGYVIAMSIGTNAARNSGFRVGEFGASRFFRIAPPLLVVIFGTLVLEVALMMTGYQWASAMFAARNVYLTDAAGQIIALLTLCLAGDLTGAWLNGPLWSLAYEVQLYVIAGLGTAVFLGRSARARSLAGVALAGYLVLLLSGPFDRVQAVCFGAFGFGTIGYRLRSCRYGVWLVAAALAASLTALCVAVGPRIPLQQVDLNVHFLGAQLALSALLGVGVILVARAPAWPILRNAGSYSYTLYIAHFPVLLCIYFLLSNLLPQALWAFAGVTAAVATAATWLSLAYLGQKIERPGAQRRWLTSLRRTPRPPAITGQTGF